MGKITLEEIVDQVNDLPALPHVVGKIIQLTEDPDATAQDINKVLNQDQGMTAKVLRLANSAFYGFPRRISSITDATIFLGFRTVRGIVMAASVSDLLSEEMEGYALAQGELWGHSQSVAMASRCVAQYSKFIGMDVAYTAGLLHDIGKVILNTYMKEAYKEVIDKAAADDIPFMQAEQDILGFNHAQIGARVAEKWNLPEDLVEAIAYHHQPEQAVKNKKLTAIVHIADAICLMMGIGMGVDGMLYPLSSESMQLLNLDELAIEQIISNMTDLLADEETFAV